MKIRKYVLFVNILLTGFVLWSAYAVYGVWATNRQKGPIVSVPGDPQSAKETQTNRSLGFAHYQPIIGQDIFGTSIRKQADPALSSPKTEPKPEEIKVSRRNLHLKGTVVGGNEGESYAVISDGKSEGEVYRLNDLLQNARIVEILPDRVILEAQGKHEAIVISYELGLNGPGSAPKDAFAAEHPRGLAVPPSAGRNSGGVREARRLPGR